MTSSGTERRATNRGASTWNKVGCSRGSGSRVKRPTDRWSLQLQVTRGPLVEMQFEGAAPPAKVVEEVRAAMASRRLR